MDFNIKLNGLVGQETIYCPTRSDNFRIFTGELRSHLQNPAGRDPLQSKMSPQPKFPKRCAKSPRGNPRCNGTSYQVQWGRGAVSLSPVCPCDWHSFGQRFSGRRAHRSLCKGNRDFGNLPTRHACSARPRGGKRTAQGPANRTTCAEVWNVVQTPR